MTKMLRGKSATVIGFTFMVGAFLALTFDPKGLYEIWLVLNMLTMALMTHFAFNGEVTPKGFELDDVSMTYARWIATLITGTATAVGFIGVIAFIGLDIKWYVIPCILFCFVSGYWLSGLNKELPNA